MVGGWEAPPAGDAVIDERSAGRHGASPVGIRALIVTNAGKPPDSELRRRIAADEMPDVISPEAGIDPTYVDDRLFVSMTGVRGWLARHLPYRMAQVVEVCLRARSHDLVVAWSDLPSILVAAALRFVPDRPAVVAIVMWPSKPKKAIPLRLVEGGIDRFIHFAPLQRRFLEERLRIAPERILDGRSRVDTRFWRPMAPAAESPTSAAESPTSAAESPTTAAESPATVPWAAGGGVCAVGQEMRDYATLVEALRNCAMPCHIAVGSSFLGCSDERWWRRAIDARSLPPNVTVGPKSFTELRELYARSRFVVIPLIPSDNSNGLTATLEAFAMGKAVIVTDSPGQVGLLEEGVNCLRVPPRDPAALLAAMERLWNDPDLCERMGAAGRELVVSECSLDHWTTTLTRAAVEAVALRAALRGAQPAVS